MPSAVAAIIGADRGTRWFTTIPIPTTTTAITLTGAAAAASSPPPPAATAVPAAPASAPPPPVAPCAADSAPRAPATHRDHNAQTLRFTPPQLATEGRRGRTPLAHWRHHALLE